MSASLTISTASLGANGKTLTANIAGASGSLSPASGITGFKGFGGGLEYAQTASTASGTAVTIVLDAPIAIGVTVTLNLDPSSNLRDGAGNSPTGQTGVAVTNSSAAAAATYSYTNAAFKWYGRTFDAAPSRWMTATGSEVVFVALGTACTITATSPDLPFTVSVDGGAASQPLWPGTAGAYADCTMKVFYGLADAEHRVVIKSVGNSKIKEFNIFGATRTIRALTASEGYGPYLRIGDATFASCARQDNLSGIVLSGYTDPSAYTNNTSVSSQAWVNGGFRFKARVDTIKVWLIFATSVQMQLQKDGISVGGVVTSTENIGWSQVAASGLDDGAEHVYTIVYKNTCIIDAILLGGANAALAATAPESLEASAFYGDSIVGGGSFGDSLSNWTHKLCVDMDKVEFNAGIPWSQVQGLDSGDGSIRFGDIGAIAPDPKECFVLYGTNDITASGSSSVPTAPFRAGFDAMLNGLLNGTVPTVIYVMGILPRKDVSLAAIAAWNGTGNGIQGSIAAISSARPADAERLKFIDTSGWGLEANNYATYYNVDGLHPNQAGSDLIYGKLLETLEPGAGGSNCIILSEGSFVYGSMSGPETIPGPATKVLQDSLVAAGWSVQDARLAVAVGESTSCYGSMRKPDTQSGQMKESLG